MQFFRAEDIDSIRVSVGESFRLESLRQAVVPPYLMLMPYLDVPDGVQVEEQAALDEDGVHGCTWVLKSVTAGEYDLAVGFRDIQTREETHRKVIHVSSSD